jgi:hypothetical protein
LALSLTDWLWMACRTRVTVVFVEQLLMAGLGPKPAFSRAGAQWWLSCVLIAAAWRRRQHPCPGSPSQQGMSVAGLFDIEAVSLDDSGHGKDCERGHYR